MTPYYDEDGVTLYCSDSRDLLPAMPVVDLVLTSPPYNLGTSTGGGFPLGHYSASDGKLGRRGGGGKWNGGALRDGYGVHDDAMPHEDYMAWQHDTLRALWSRLSDQGAIFYNHKPRVLAGALVAPMDYVPSELRPFVRQEVIWARAGGVNFSPAFYLPTHERIVIIARPDFRLRDKAASSVGDVWYIPQESNTEHPAPFPLALAKQAIETTPARVVLDPFAGSGTTLEAARLLGRRAIGIEINPAYCEIAKRRLAQGVLFGAGQ
jgi:site-specific DNA-methyltransferase (adenine-specific)